jgi:hypothetical protein
MRREAMIAGAAGLLAVVVASRLRRRRPAGVAAPAAHAGLALWSFWMATVQGAGLMLVPALLPICLGSGGSAASGASGRSGSRSPWSGCTWRRCSPPRARPRSPPRPFWQKHLPRGRGRRELSL